MLAEEQLAIETKATEIRKKTSGQHVAIVHNEQPAEDAGAKEEGSVDEIQNNQQDNHKEDDSHLPIKIKPKSIWERSKSDDEQQLRSRDDSKKILRKAKSVSDANSMGLQQGQFMSMDSNTLSAVPTIEEDDGDNNTKDKQQLGEDQQLMRSHSEENTTVEDPQLSVNAEKLKSVEVDGSSDSPTSHQLEKLSDELHKWSDNPNEESKLAGSENVEKYSEESKMSQSGTEPQENEAKSNEKFDGERHGDYSFESSLTTDEPKETTESPNSGNLEKSVPSIDLQLSQETTDLEPNQETTDQELNQETSDPEDNKETTDQEQNQETTDQEHNQETTDQEEKSNEKEISNQRLNLGTNDQELNEDTSEEDLNHATNGSIKPTKESSSENGKRSSTFEETEDLDSVEESTKDEQKLDEHKSSATREDGDGSSETSEPAKIDEIFGGKKEEASGNKALGKYSKTSIAEGTGNKLKSDEVAEDDGAPIDKVGDNVIDIEINGKTVKKVLKTKSAEEEEAALDAMSNKLTKRALVRGKPLYSIKEREAHKHKSKSSKKNSKRRVTYEDQIFGSKESGDIRIHELQFTARGEIGVRDAAPHRRSKV